MAIQAQFPSWLSQDWTDNGCGGFNNFCFDVQQQQRQTQNHQSQEQRQQHQQEQQQQQHCNLQLLQNQLNQQWERDQNLFFDNNSSLKHSYCGNNPSMPFYQSMAVLDQKQAQEIDHCIRLQDQRLRFFLQEQRKRLFALLCKTVESKVVPFLRQKDEEIARAAKKKQELEDQVNRLETENVAWRRLLQEREAMIVSLHNTIERLREKATPFCSNNGAADAESCCDAYRDVETVQRFRFRGLVEDNIEEEDGDNEVERARKMMVCKCCNSRNSCILFLPCRHLCSCKACDAFLDSCPVCQTAKKASIEALMV